MSISVNWLNLLRPNIRAMDPYQPVVPLARISEQIGRPIDSFVKLDANENPYGPSPKAAAALAGIQDLHRYPDADSRRLRQSLSVAAGLPMDYLLTGAGADEAHADGRPRRPQSAPRRRPLPPARRKDARCAL